MRLNNYLIENSDKEEFIYKAFDIIKKKCKPFLKDWLPIIKPMLGGTQEIPYMYRGVSLADDFGERVPRDNRKPLSSRIEFHKAMDNELYKKFGIRGRSQAVFVTSELNDAEEYGVPIIVFPVGNYKIVWSEDIGDLFMSADRFGWSPVKTKMERAFYRTKSNLRKDFDRDKAQKQAEEENEKAIDKIISEYKIGDLKGALKSGNEIMLSCKSYMYLNYKKYYWEIEDIIKKVF